MKILVVKTSAIGDVLHTMPAVNALRRHWPNAHITWLVEEAAADLVCGHPAVNRVLIARRKSWVDDLSRLRVRAISDAWSFVRNLRDTRYDLLIDFQALLKSGIWVLLAKSKRKVGFGRGMAHSEWSWLFLNERVPAVSMDTHAIERELMLLEPLGVPRGSIEFNVPIEARHRDAAARLLQNPLSGKSRPLVVLCPMTLWRTKLWDEGKWSETADALHVAGLGVAFAGSQADRTAIDAMCARMHHQPIRLDGQTDLLTLGAVFQRAAVVLTTDTGPMHLAAAVGAPLVALFGPTAPWRTGPWGHRCAVIRVAELTCSPCFKKSCQTKDYEPNACMKRLLVPHVVQAVLAHMQAPVVARL